MDWRSLSPKELERQYSPSQFGKRPLPNYLEEYHQLSMGHDTALLHKHGQPLLIYIHGGYWQKLSAADSLFNAADAIREGVSLHAVEYTLAPRAEIQTMVTECVNEILGVIEQLQPIRTVLAGSSAGAHLSGMCLRDQRVSSRVDAAVLLSGIYDIRPLVYTTTNEPLHLTEESASQLSPLLLSPQPGIATALCAVGEHESNEFKRQNDEFASFLRKHACEATSITVDGCDHFDLPYDLLKAETIVGQWTLHQLKENSQ